ncbi:hypothetical protein [Rhodoferax sp.]|uniref:hypothetical protein n=1 Tax=Rhodoferax sp. TaxID=50421 RepID=UPI002ACED884|nr:hypothetical protein [Rhodoferax sp.]MDZ7920725.1 hypothetical protein [Rhodoferax sp.]
MSIDKIEGAAKTLRAARDLLTERATSLHEEMQAATKRKLPGLRKAVADVVEAEAILKAAIAEAPSQFEKPRSMVLHGLKLGFQKGKGKIEWDDDEKVVKLIAKHFPEEFEVLCTTTIKPVKAALGNLSVAELKKIGVTVEETGDVVFVKDSTAGVDKLVKALLKGAEDEAEAA